jgi:predicted nucleic acid-binding protein
LLRKAGQADKPVHMTEVNHAEVKCMLLRKDGAAGWNEAAKVLVVLPIEFHPVTRELADQAAHFKSRCKFSLADACAAAPAKLRNAELVTGDPEFEEVAGEIKIAWLK